MSTALRRADALDALRGIAVILMVLSGYLHFPDHLPAWMYHAQVPPPDFRFNPDLPGITWVDLVFPFFLFAMGAAIPFGLSRRMTSGVPLLRTVGTVLLRGALLIGFALVVQHTKPFVISTTPGAAEWGMGLLSFAAIFIVLVRFPSSMSEGTAITVRTGGVVLLLLILSLLRYPDGSGFLLTRSDIIIIVLANMAVAGSLLWMATRENVLLRLGVLGFLMAFRLTQSVEGSWNQWLWTATPAPWMYKLYYLQYLYLVIPGTVAGDILLQWTRLRSGEEGAAGVPRTALLTTAFLLIAVVTATVAGLFARAVLLTIAADAVLLLIALLLLRNATGKDVAVLRTLFGWGVYWLVLGFCFEAYEGGIKKDHPTMSYYFVTAGLAHFVYIAFSIITDLLRRPRTIGLLIDVGQNPMVAYVAGNLVVVPLLSLTGILPILTAATPTAWLGFLRGSLLTAGVAFVAAYCTKKGLLWRT